ncbi:hypothetical protein IWQ60_007294 [Tieghemiomyces parasiticus]|uniref:Uncharacterized protein n=1 Tax=Tieghemiomyces parasiticus TaxID=78921 RepID=A0A9W8A467_9FUNG|nr:hypothetical protein IWQ60_007294 [Tieghemiomyces parasiticus]
MASWRLILLLGCLLALTQAVGASDHSRLYPRDECPAGSILCDFFGCVPGAQCPDQCNARTAATCGFSVNGHGCRLEADKCIQDLTCAAPVNGTCAAGCTPCDTMRCTVAGLTCPTPCAGIADPNTCNGSAALNGLGCRWSNNKCSDFSFDGKGFTSVAPLPSPTSSTSASSATASSSSTSSNDDDGGDSPDMAPVRTSDMGRIGAIIGGVVGALAFAGILILVVHRYLQKKAQRERNGIRLDDSDVAGLGMKVPSIRYKPDEFLPAVRSALHLGNIKHTHNSTLPAV